VKLVFGPGFRHIYKKRTRRNPELRESVERTLYILATDPFHPSLRTHKLKGSLAETWACTIDYENRLLFEFAEHPDTGTVELLLLTLGSHDEVY